MSEHDEKSRLTYRAGAAAVGLLAGVALGLFVALVSAFLGFSEVLVHVFFGVAAASAFAGFIFPEAAFCFGEAVVNFFVGMASGVSDQEVRPDNQAPGWLRYTFWLGVVAGFAVLAQKYYWRSW